jgi:hypothetical protein
VKPEVSFGVLLRKLDGMREIKALSRSHAWNAREIFFDKKIGELQTLVRHFRLNRHRPKRLDGINQFDTV